MRTDFADRTIAKVRQSKVKQPACLCQGRLSASFTTHFAKQLIGNQPKGYHPRLLLELPVHGWINALGQIFFGRVALSAGIRKRNRRVDTKGQQFLFAGKPIRKAPQLCASRLDEKKKSAAIKKLHC